MSFQRVHFELRFPDRAAMERWLDHEQIDGDEFEMSFKPRDLGFFYSAWVYLEDRGVPLPEGTSVKGTLSFEDDHYASEAHSFASRLAQASEFGAVGKAVFLDGIDESDDILNSYLDIQGSDGWRERALSWDEFLWLNEMNEKNALEDGIPTLGSIREALGTAPKPETEQSPLSFRYLTDDEADGLDWDSDTPAPSTMPDGMVLEPVPYVGDDVYAAQVLDDPSDPEARVLVVTGFRTVLMVGCPGRVVSEIQLRGENLSVRSDGRVALITNGEGTWVCGIKGNNLAVLHPDPILVHNVEFAFILAGELVCSLTSGEEFVLITGVEEAYNLAFQE